MDKCKCECERLNVSPTRPRIIGISNGVLVMKMAFNANCSDVIPDDGVVRRELHVVDPVEEKIFVHDPTETVLPFVCNPVDGAQAVAFLVDFDQANNPSIPAQSVTFEITPPDTTGPSQPTIFSVDFVGMVPDDVPPPTPNSMRAAAMRTVRGAAATVAGPKRVDMRRGKR